MANNTTDDIIFSARAARMRATDAAGTQTILLAELMEVILEAVDDGLYTITYASSGETSKNIQWCMEQLIAAGYTVTLSSTGPTFNISW